MDKALERFKRTLSIDPQHLESQMAIKYPDSWQPCFSYPTWDDVRSDPTKMNPEILSRLQKSMGFQLREGYQTRAAIVIRGNIDEFQKTNQ